ncbi:hypothetical protein SADUNF_Sadunf11G0007600 [Salix dunnii]|uniref:Uncharacterized protein n=1 Tax=Salix dunnii TaxID=1413687 RepID=A0A835JPC5_9ROSI|nr:hypothetical protein SADUNF_Sadunf11G0007600 [Salix dunnii]
MANTANKIAHENKPCGSSQSTAGSENRETSSTLRLLSSPFKNNSFISLSLSNNMDRPQRISIKELHVILYPCSSRRSRTSSDSNSPEFEFWIQSPSFP